MKLSIVRADSGHLESLVPLFDHYRVFYGRESDLNGVRGYLTERMATSDSVIFLAINDQRNALGFSQLFPSLSSIAMGRVWILNDLFVAEEVRRRGVARQLLNSVSKFAVASDAVRVDLATAKDNVAAKSLYEAMGYSVDTAFDHYKWHV